MKRNTEKLFWLVAIGVVLGIVAACNMPRAKFKPGDWVINNKGDDFKRVLKNHCRPFADYCTYDLGDVAWDPPDQTGVNELWLTLVTLSPSRQ